MRKILLTALTVLAISCAGDKTPTKEIRSEEDIAGLRISTLTGSCYDMELSGRDDITLVRFNTETDIINSVAIGAVDACVYDEVVFNADVRKQLGVKIAFHGKDEYPAGFGFRKEDIELRAECDAMLEEMKADGSLDSLCTLWLSDEGVDPSTLTPPLNNGTEKPLRITTGCSIAPISFMVGDTWYGLECELMYRLGQRLNRPVEFKYYDSASYMFSLFGGMSDILTGCLFITPEREETTAFSVPYYYYKPAYFIKDTEAANAAKTGIWTRISESFRRSLIVEQRWKYITGGLWETLKITLLSILLGSILGCGICACARSRKRGLKKFAHIYNVIVTGIPMLVLLLIMFYVVLVNTGLGATAIAIVAFSIYFAAASGEVFSNSLASVPHAQTEASLALGFTKAQAFFTVVLPQAVRYGLPFYKRQCIELLKATSIVGYLAIQDLTRAGDIIRSRTFDALLPLLIVTVIYFLLAWLIGLALNLAAGKNRSL